MDLLEYQAKEIFAQVGIPILPSQPIHEPGGLKRLNIPYPIVLKSQVRAGGRGKAGGVKFVANTIDAIAAAHAIFHLPIAGEYPEVILAEARYNPQQEIFLAILPSQPIHEPGGLKRLNIPGAYRDWETDRKSTRLNSSHSAKSRMPSSA